MSRRRRGGLLPAARAVVRSVVLFVVCSVVCLAAVAGCTSAAPRPTAAVRLSVSVLQYRSDFAVRKLQLEVVNHSSSEITITSAAFRSDFFPSSLRSPSAPASIPAQGTTDFPVVLPVSSCTASQAPARVTIGYRTPDGARHTVSATPTDQFEALAGIRAADCSRQAFERVVHLALAPSLRFETRGGKPVALLDLIATPTGAVGRVVIRGIQSTTLLSQSEGDLRTIGLAMTEHSKPTTLTIAVIPSRCEQHVVAEDKIGTVFPLHVDAPPFENATFGIAASDAVKLQFYAYVARYCGW